MLQICKLSMNNNQYLLNSWKVYFDKKRKFFNFNKKTIEKLERNVLEIGCIVQKQWETEMVNTANNLLAVTDHNSQVIFSMLNIDVDFLSHY